MSIITQAVKEVMNAVSATEEDLKGLGTAFTNLSHQFSTVAISMSTPAYSMANAFKDMLDNAYYAMDSDTAIAGAGIHTPHSGTATPGVLKTMHLPTHGLVYAEQFKITPDGYPPSSLYGGTWVNEWALEGEWLAPGIPLE
jgi:hypothetical protein